MLHLLLYLAALGQLTGANTPPTETDISSCPVLYFGKLYTTIYVDSSGGKLSVCFKGPYSPGAKNDCLLASYGGVTDVEVRIENNSAGPGSDFHLSLGQLTGSSPCAVSLILKDDRSADHMLSQMRRFEDQAAVSVSLQDAFTQSSLEVDVQVDGVSLRHFNFTQKNKKYFRDLSGCRHSGVVYEPNTVACNSNSSSVVTCDASAAFSVSPCGPGRRCQGNGQCVVYSTCTVTGPTVIDFNGHVSSVQDRCAYTLMSAAGLQLLATFQERRRKDVSFLERVILRLDGSGVDIHLGQGGNVQLNHTTLRLNSSAQLIHGVELSKDKSRVTAKVTFSNYSTSILFDGTTAQIHVKGPGSLQGLCVNSSSLSEVRLSEFSSSSCETQYSEPADGRIDCTMMTARCNLLKEAPFTSCHSHVDPEPHVTACTSVLCLYPAGDGLRCQFLEVYAQACSLHSNHTLEGWRSKASCSPPQDLCQDTSCSAHEFCGEDMSGRPRCLCRAGFASKYRTRGALGDPTVCRENSASVSLAACLLAEKGINHSVLHLNDHTCTGQMDEKTHMVTFGFNTSKPCGTVISAAKNKIIYSNTIKTDNSSTSGPISRQSLVNVNFSCFYSQPDVKSMSFKVKGGTVMQQIISGSWNYSLSMSMCADLACTQPIDFSKGVQLDQTIYMSIETDGLDGNLINMKTESCWATNNENGNGGLRYDLVKNGCSNPQDSTVMIIPNGKGTGSILVFRMFQFRGNNNKIFLHCKMKLCLKSSPSCQQTCQRRGRKKRSVRPDYEDENPAFVTVALGP
ncbi:alpha-tectorin-like [Seriola lalandi dorsalis]|uniref:alpha-tectorin-like n=1 Tax=Seriola lalandi dorsalis TaxID=1841481 RepID=UPI000C6FBC6F|nr:alpha-tectorin-like [Seriola lalandi dorsalis]